MTERLCPNCGSKSIRPSNDSLFRTGRELQQYFCDDCGYLGPLVVEKNGPLNPRMISDLKKVKSLSR